MAHGASKLLEADRRIYLVATGAGAGLQKLLWDVPGISRVLVGAEFPYAADATDRFLGFVPGRYCSGETAIALAIEAYYRAFQPRGAPAVGLGLTASVASTAEHRGDHRVFVASVTDGDCRLYSARLSKDHGTDARARDGEISDTLGLAALLSAAGHAEEPRALSGVLDFQSECCAKAALRVVLEHPLFTASGKRGPAPGNGNGLTLFPGAFDPPHDAHLWMAREHSATFHVTIDPPHKPQLGIAEVIQRAKLLEDFDRIFTAGDPLYIDKARRFPGARILLGADALVRLLDPAWGHELEPMVREFRSLGIRFLVADRVVNGELLTLDSVEAPRDICQRILRPSQHLSLSSTKLRELPR
jgi:hypothetical protein